MHRTYIALVAGALALQCQAHAQETLAGVGAASGMAAGLGAMAASNINPQKLTNGIGQPRMPSESDISTTTLHSSSTTSTIKPAVGTSSLTGEIYLNELLGHPYQPLPTTRMSARQRANFSRRLRHMSRAQRNRYIYSKYHLPARGWLSYYLPQDRYKVASELWQYVSIEDDPGDYPVHYYYRPSSIQMLSILSRRPRNGQARANRVIGFHSWQDAMVAGYRPDPISRPDPAPGIVYLAQMARTPQLARYVEYVYAGQVLPESFASSVTYAHQVETILRSRADTRLLLSQTMQQVVGAYVGDNPLPTSVGGAAPVLVAAKVRAPAAGGAPAVLPGGTADKRQDDFGNFSNKAGKLANVPGNR